MISTIYKTIAYTIKERLPEIKHFDLYNNQYNNYEDNSPIRTPAVFLEIPPINMSQLLRGVQYGAINVNIHLFIDKFRGTEFNSKGFEKSLNDINIIDKLYVALNRCNSNIIPEDKRNDLFYQGAFKRTGITFNSGSIGTGQSHIITGEFILLDKSAADLYNSVELSDINLDVKYFNRN